MRDCIKAELSSRRRKPLWASRVVRFAMGGRRGYLSLGAAGRRWRGRLAMRSSLRSRLIAASFTGAEVASVLNRLYPELPPLPSDISAPIESMTYKHTSQ